MITTYKLLFLLLLLLFLFTTMSENNQLVVRQLAPVSPSTCAICPKIHHKHTGRSPREPYFSRKATQTNQAFATCSRWVIWIDRYTSVVTTKRRTSGTRLLWTHKYGLVGKRPKRYQEEARIRESLSRIVWGKHVI